MACKKISLDHQIKQISAGNSEEDVLLKNLQLKKPSAPMRPPSPPPPFAPKKMEDIKRLDSVKKVETLYEHLYHVVEPKPQNLSIFVLSAIEILFAILVVASATVCICVSHPLVFCPHYTSAWCGVVFLCAGIAGLAAAHVNHTNVYVAALVSSVVSAVSAVILCALSIRNWLEAGIYYDQGLSERDQLMRCVVPKYDPKRIGNIYSDHRYGFRECFDKFKTGIATNTMTSFLALVQLLLFLVSTFLILKVLCRPCRRG